MRRLLLALVVACVSAAVLVADARLSDLLNARLDAYQQRQRAVAAERQVLDAAIARWRTQEQALTTERTGLEQQLRDELHPPADTVWNWQTGQFDAVTPTAPRSKEK